MDDVSPWVFVWPVLLLAVALSPLIIGLLVMGPQRRLPLVHPGSGLRKDGFYGFSLTYAFFGFLVPVFRGEIGIGMLHLVFSAFTGGLFQLIMAFLYNRQFTTRQLTTGWVLADPVGLDDRARRSLNMVPA